MNHKYRMTVTISILLLAAVLTMLIANIAMGPINIPVPKIWGSILGFHRYDDVYTNIIWKIRMPRALAAVFGGAALSLSGLLLQVLFRNPLADPFILGITPGSSLVVGLVVFLGAALGLNAVHPFLLAIAAFIGAMVVMTIVLATARKIKNIVTLLIVGIMVGYLCNAFTNLMIAFAQKEQLHLFTIWGLGSFSGFSWPETWILIGVATILTGSSMAICKPLNALILGEDYARSMGVPIKRLRIGIILISCFLSGTMTAFAGPVAFIGLAVPYISRLSCKTSDNRVLIPLTVLLGGFLTSFCDLVARTALRPVEIPISAITSFFGVPLVIVLLLRRNHSL